MKTAVRYYSWTGNTKKLAQAIGSAVGVQAETIESPVSQPVDLLFLGSGVYAGNMHDEMKRFLEALSVEKVKQVAVFSNSFGDASPYPAIKTLLESKGISVRQEQFHCKGKFLLFKRKHPDSTDCANAAAFAKRIVNIQ